MNKKSHHRFILRLCIFPVCICLLTNCRNDSADFTRKYYEIAAHYLDRDPHTAEISYKQAIELCGEYRTKSRDFDFDYFIGDAHARLSVLLEKQRRIQESKNHLELAALAFAKSRTASHVKTEKDVVEYLEYMGYKEN